MTTRILQSDGTYCYSGPNCQKHGGGAYRDRQGNPATRAELVKKMEKAMRYDQYAIYVAERENLERIDKIVAEMEEPSPDDVIDGWKSANKPQGDDSGRGLVLNKDEEEKAWRTFSFYYPDESDSPSETHYVSSDLVNFSPDDTLKHYGIGKIVASYSALATYQGLQVAKNTQNIKTVMNDTLSVRGVDGTTFTVQESTLTKNKINAAVDHMSWREKMNRALTSKNARAAHSQKEFVQSLLNEQIKNTEAFSIKFNKARFEFNYDQKNLTEDTYEELVPRMSSNVNSMQRLHDEVIFAKLKERELSHLLSTIK